ncbi:MAG: hypothetical protein RIC24_03485 [Hyphomicrobiales bacterium]|jgi:hypothetical protein
MSWKSVVAGALALAAHCALATSPSHADPNTCVGSAPNGSSLPVFDQPNPQSAVLGGIGVGQCDITVTNQCEGNWCVIVYQGLNGWIEMRHLTGSPVQPPAGATGQQSGGAVQTFEVIGGSGTVTMMGQTQPTPVDPGDTVSLTPIDGSTARLSMPAAIFPSQPTMQRGPGGVWTGSFGEWAGIPADVTVTLRDLTTPTPLLILDGTSPMAEFFLELQLRPVGGSSGVQQGTANAPAQQRQANADSCAQLEAMSARINAMGNTDIVQEFRGIYVVAGLAFGGAQTPDNCQQALDLIAASPSLQGLLASGGSGQSSNRGAVHNASANCSAVDEIAVAIEQANDRRLNALFGQLIDEVGIMDLFAANEDQCGRLLDLLEMEGIVDAPSVAVQAGIGPSNGMPPAPTPAQSQGLSNACREVLVIDQAVEAVNNRTVSLIFGTSMESIPMTDVFSATEGECLALLELLAMEGMGSPEQVRQLAQSFGETRAPVAPVPTTQAAACDALASAIRPVLRGGVPEARRAVLSTLQANGVTDVGSASQQSCGQAMAQLIASNAIPDDGVGWGTASVAQPESPARTPPPSTANDNACLVLGDRIVAVVNRGLNRELTAMSDILASTGIRSLSGETETACASALDAASAAGLGR